MQILYLFRDCISSMSSQLVNSSEFFQEKEFFDTANLYFKKQKLKKNILINASISNKKSDF